VVYDSGLFGKWAGSPRWRTAAKVALFLGLAIMTGVLIGPLFRDFSTYGTHDWDSMAAYRYVTVEAIKRYHEGPWWHPWLCGGFAGWAYAEGASNLVSPYLPFYLIFPVQVALRIEVLGGALAGLVGTYLFVSRFTKSIALRGLVVVLYMYNTRWAMQTGMGHGWHLQYSYLPLALYFFDRSLRDGHRRDALYAGIVMAFMVYAGGIYPVPHAAIALVVYALATAVVTRTWVPLQSLVIAGSSALGLAAPKMVPIIDLMRRFPRKLDSVEAYDLRQIWLMMTSPEQNPAIGGLTYGWHEFGIYISWVGAGIVFFSLLFGRGQRVLPLRILGIVFFVLGMGAFLPYAPWTLLHEVAPFSSQHVPSRFIYPAVLFLSAAFVASMRKLERLTERTPWCDVLLLLPVFWLGSDLVKASTAWTHHMFYLEAPPVAHEPVFHHTRMPPADYRPPDAWAGASLLSMFGNTGFLLCYSVPDRGDPKGAIGIDDPAYKGEVYFAEGSGEATITKWTPNSAEVHIEHATPDSVLVYNMNFEPSWRANGAPAIEYRHAVATRISSGTQRVKFSYYPRTLNASLFVFLVTCFACFGVRPARRWWEARRTLATAERAQDGRPALL
jgi:hypothetical protein